VRVSAKAVIWWRVSAMTAKDKFELPAFPNDTTLAKAIELPRQDGS